MVFSDGAGYFFMHSKDIMNFKRILEGEAMETHIYWSSFAYKGWSLYVAATNKGLCFVGNSYKEFVSWVDKHFKQSVLVGDDEQLQPYIEELMEYIDGKRTEFTCEMDYKGTDFQMSVWRALCNIPFGKTRSYSEIAMEIGKPTAVRAAGAAIGANPLLIVVPCHRVIGKNGTLTGFRGGLDMKERLLRLEGK